MNQRINAVLEDIQQTLESDGQIGVPADVGGKTNADAEAGSGGAINPSEVSNTLDLYLSNIADLLVLEYGYSEADAMNFVFNAADALAADGVIQEIPGDTVPDDETAHWLGQAKSVQFAAHVLDRARKMQTA